MNRRAPALLSALALSAGACAFDLSGYQAAGDGGSSSTSASSSGSSSSSSSLSSTSASSSTASASTTTATTTASSSDASSSASSGTGGAPPVGLDPCGGFTSDFQTFDSPPWTTHDTSQTGPTNKKYVQSDIGFDFYANAHLDGAAYQDCYASIDLVGHSGGSAFLRLYEGLINQTSITIDGNKNLGFPGGSTHLNGWPVALGLAFVGDQVFYLYIPAGGMSWEPPVAVKNRSDWMNDGDDDELGFGVNGIINDSASFDSFNMRPITYADLGLPSP